MTERMQTTPSNAARTGRCEATTSRQISYPELRVGVEGYQQDMTRFPILTYEQTLVAVSAFQSGQCVDDLRSHPLFASHLQAEERRLILPRFDGVGKRGIYYSSKGEQDDQATEDLYARV